MSARDVHGLVGQRHQLAGTELIDVAALASDVCDDRAVAAPDTANERSEVQLLRNPRLVVDRPRQRKRKEEVVTGRGEHGYTADPLPAELAAEPVLDPLDVARKRFPFVVGECRALLVQLPLGACEQRPRGRGEIPRPRHDARVEPDVDADRAAMRRPEGRELAQLLPGDCCGHAAHLPRATDFMPPGNVNPAEIV